MTYKEIKEMNYKFIGLELTPEIFKELLILLFDGKQFSRRAAVDEIVNYHKANGGSLAKESYVPAFKKAVQSLKNKGIENVGYGVWRLQFVEKDKEIEILPSPGSDANQVSYEADKVIGKGKRAVYVYYYDTYKELALLKGNKRWECKIGRTDVDPIARIFSQSGTCYPESPHLALIIYCEDSLLLEKAFHSILKINNKWLIDSPGKEWFLTSPEEIEQMYHSIIQKDN